MFAQTVKSNLSIVSSMGGMRMLLFMSEGRWIFSVCDYSNDKYLSFDLTSIFISTIVISIEKSVVGLDLWTPHFIHDLFGSLDPHLIHDLWALSGPHSFIAGEIAQRGLVLTVVISSTPSTYVGSITCRTTWNWSRPNAHSSHGRSSSASTSPSPPTPLLFIPFFPQSLFFFFIS